MKSIGAPICGDLIYDEIAQAHLMDRTYLHAYMLRFSLAGQEYCFQQWPCQGQLFTTDAFLALQATWQDPLALDWPERRP